ncbi:AraC family transcriptional regulator [Microbacterium sp. 4R-513]|uniref:helix-turn-helix domain-containing protein n=1 Tax=Microbacterium sp. 4R-513 TaxID=2567934 RepID=UPI0013E1C792|nr:helix-turn-helix domain-containing protein [Microbacterium sp. 4R-513]QIG40211.1 AraC family transcriptional regulator [Microbacterium sp. 4R-513]
MTDPTRGVLYPDRLPRFSRIPAGDEASPLAAWFWIPQWELADGVESRQPILGYPAANLVVEGDQVTLWGATTRASERVLRGSGWAVGALLRPAALAWLTEAPSDLVDASVAIDAPDLRDAVTTAMPDETAAAAAFAEWLTRHAGPVTPEGRLANAMVELLMTDASLLRVEDAAERLRVSVRTLQRLAHRTVGLPPAAMIRRRRLQEAAQRVREDPEASLAGIASELGYADQAHLAKDFRTVLGFTATVYRVGG